MLRTCFVLCQWRCCLQGVECWSFATYRRSRRSCQNPLTFIVYFHCHSRQPVKHAAGLEMGLKHVLWPTVVSKGSQMRTIQSSHQQAPVSWCLLVLVVNKVKMCTKQRSPHLILSIDFQGWLPWQRYQRGGSIRFSVCCCLVCVLSASNYIISFHFSPTGRTIVHFEYIQWKSAHWQISFACWRAPLSVSTAPTDSHTFSQADCVT